MASINFQLNLGYALTFLLAGSAIVSMHMTHATLRGLQLHLAPLTPVFAGLPVDLAVRVEGSESGARRTAEFLGEAAGRAMPPGTTMLGPAPAAIERIRGKHRWHLLFRARDAQALLDRHAGEQFEDGVDFRARDPRGRPGPAPT